MIENPFEIPQAVRDVSEQSLKQARAAYEQLMDFMTKAMGAWRDALPSNPMATVFKEVQGRAMKIAMANAESVFTFADKISNVRTPQDIVTLEMLFAQERMQAFVTQTQQLFSVSEEAIQKVERGDMDAGMGAMPSNLMTAGFKDVQDRAVEIAQKNAESVSALTEMIAKAQNFPAPSDNALPAEKQNSPSGSSQEKPLRRKSAKSKTATSGTSTTSPLASPTPLTPHTRPHSKPQAAKKSRGTRRGS